MSQPRPYMREPWFVLLKERCQDAVQSHIARQLGVSATTLSMVLNGTGPYGDGSASTAHVADKVIHTFGRYTCPHLTADGDGVPVVITADQCRAHAHRPPPTSSPRAMQHWQACRHCPHREASAPPIERIPVPRKTARPVPVTPPSTEKEASDEAV